MNKKWEIPRISIEQFTANEYVSLCYSGTIVLDCTLMDNSNLHEPGNRNNKYYYERNGKLHQSDQCGKPASITFNGYTGKETGTNAAPISNVVITGAIINADGVIQNGTYYNCTWDSTLSGNQWWSGVYHHVGTATVSNVRTGVNNS